MDLLFAADSWWNWDAEKNFARIKKENPQLVQAAHGNRAGSISIKPDVLHVLSDKSSAKHLEV